MSAFNLNSSNTDFNVRQKKVFDQLLVLENHRKNVLSEEPNNRTNQIPNRDNRKAQKNETKHFRGRESMFKRPQNPAPKNYINKIPDFKKNPHKWTKYSLEHVQDVTDESNKKSAMDFLKQLAERRKIEQGITEEGKLEELPSKIVFNKYVKIRKEKEQDSDVKVTFSSSKVIMPEYVIGHTPAKEKSSKKNKPGKGRELKLDHLSYDDDDDDDQ